MHSVGRKIPVPQSIVRTTSRQCVTLFALFQRFLCMLVRQLSAYPRYRDGKINRLRQIIVGPQLQCRNNVVALCFCGDHDDWKLGWRIVLAQGFQGIKAADVRHLNVQQHQVHGVSLNTLQQFLRARCQSDDVTLASEPAGEHVPVHFIVVYDEQSARPQIHSHFFTVSKLSIFSLSRPNSTGLVS